MSEDLPADLHGLLRRQGTRINHESFSADASRLAESLRPATVGTSTGTGTKTPGKIWLSRKANIGFSVAALIFLLIGATSGDLTTMDMSAIMLSGVIYLYIGIIGVRAFLVWRAKRD